MPRSTRQCPRTLALVYEPDEDRVDAEEEPAVDWDAWASGRMRGRGRWWLIVMVMTMAAMTALYIRSNGAFIPWGPPR